ncbi:MAG: flagellar biosynthesis protein FlhF [Phycisphaeraceae bacterium]
MNLKTFTAGSMAQALALVKRELGSDAVVLHTRTYKRGGILGIGAKTVVEVTAGRGADIALARHRQALANRNAALPKRRPPIQQADPSRHIAAGDLIRRTYAAAKAEIEQSRSHSNQSAASDVPASPKPKAHIAPPPSADTHQLAQEMSAVKHLVARMMHQQKKGADLQDLPKGLSQQYAALIQQEVECELADEIVSQVRRGLTEEQLQDESACREAVRKALAKYMPTDAQLMQAKPTEDGRPRTIALVGPTGVGKTTTIAKLAATFKLKHKKNVALITLDTYRIAAVDQLRTYAGIIGVPLHVVLNPGDINRAMRRCARCDVVLIDTAGRSQRDGDRLTQLKAFLEAAKPHETHLVLSSTCSQQVLLETIERFSQVHTDRIIFTKLDEAVTFGVLLNVLGKADKRLSYITTGQEVPHQIEPGCPDRLAELVLGQEVGRSL